MCNQWTLIVSSNQDYSGILRGLTEAHLQLTHNQKVKIEALSGLPYLGEA